MRHEHTHHSDLLTDLEPLTHQYLVHLRHRSSILEHECLLGIELGVSKNTVILSSMQAHLLGEVDIVDLGAIPELETFGFFTCDNDVVSMEDAHEVRQGDGLRPPQVLDLDVSVDLSPVVAQFDLHARHDLRPMRTRH